MNSIYTIEDIKLAEQTAINNGISVIELMERAGKGLYDSYSYRGKIAIICGGGKNGGDGMVLAILLKQKGIVHELYLIEDKLIYETEYFINKYLKLGGIVNYNIPKVLNDYDIIVDAIFGTGLNRDVTGKYLETIKAINDAKTFVISCDIPSGLNTNTGKMQGSAIKASLTISFSPTKAGYLLNDGMDTVGQIVYVDVGVQYPNTLIKYIGSEDNVIPKRKHNTHKGSYGKVCIIAGSPRYPGAAILATNAAESSLRSGAGLVTLAVPLSMKEVYENRVTESILFFMKDNEGKICFDKDSLDNLILTNDVIVIGMGLGDNTELKEIVLYLINNCSKTLVLDADAINSISSIPQPFKNKKGTIIITPHLKEFSRLLNCNINQIDYLNDSKKFSTKNDVIVHLKGAGSVTAYPDNRIFITNAGSPAMAKAGCGDVLSGIIGGTVACGYELASVVASIIHGKAVSVSLQEREEWSVLASDIVKNIGKL